MHTMAGVGLIVGDVDGVDVGVVEGDFDGATVGAEVGGRVG